MNNKFIILITNDGESTIYTAEKISDAEAFVKFFCKDVKHNGGSVASQYENYAFGRCSDETEFTIEIFVPGEYRNVRETDFFEES